MQVFLPRGSRGMGRVGPGNSIRMGVVDNPAVALVLAVRVLAVLLEVRALEVRTITMIQTRVDGCSMFMEMVALSNLGLRLA